MAKIHVLSQDTINKIAAGEVVERPMAVVKELVENAIDAQANAVTVEVSDGGKSLIRITDNGSGMEEDDIELAFTPHATSKIKEVTDLLAVSSLGFRGEALASIASVSQLEMVTKTKESLMGTRYSMEGGQKKSMESVGCPDGTTFLVRNLFYNTPARLKFLKTPQTEAGYISGLIERMALSHPDISFRFINQKQNRLSTSGNGNLKDVIYHIYGRDITSNLIALNAKEVFCNVNGFIAKPVVSRGNRSMMNYFINGRYIKSPVIHRAIEEAYAPYSMQHRYPFTVLHIEIDPKYIDVNVHPQKMELRFNNEKEVFQSVYHAVSEALKHREFIPEVTFASKNTDKDKSKPIMPKIEPFEKKRQQDMVNKGGIEKVAPNRVTAFAEENAAQDYAKKTEFVKHGERVTPEQSIRIIEELSKNTPEPDRYEQIDRTVEPIEDKKEEQLRIPTPREDIDYTIKTPVKNATQETLFEEGILSSKAQKELKIIGQVFSTYWILQYEDKMYMVDQHAAHEKVLYERFMKELEKKEPLTQLLQPPIILSLSMAQQQAIEDNMEIFESLGYQIENFGGKEYSVSGVPAHLPSVGSQDLLIEVIDSLAQELATAKKTPQILLEKVASMSCKAAVKGNNKLPVEEVEALLKELMTLENPYHCPHGRPTMVSMTKSEIEKKFKRIV